MCGLKCVLIFTVEKAVQPVSSIETSTGIKYFCSIL